jgi:hypothetical protein
MHLHMSTVFAVIVPRLLLLLLSRLHTAQFICMFLYASCAARVCALCNTGAETRNTQHSSVPHENGTNAHVLGCVGKPATRTSAAASEGAEQQGHGTRGTAAVACVRNESGDSAAKGAAKGRSAAAADGDDYDCSKGDDAEVTSMGHPCVPGRLSTHVRRRCVIVYVECP